MTRTPRRPDRRSHRRWRRSLLHRQEPAVASVVGTILGILVLTTLLSIIIGVWVPAMMKGREAAHNVDAYRDMLELKGTIEDQVARNDVGNTRTSAVSLGIGDVPVFVTQSAGQLNLDPVAGNVHVSNLTVGAGDVLGRNTTGRLVFKTQNNFFVQQSIIYEGGGLLIWQDSGQLVRAGPPVVATNTSGTKAFTFSQLYLVGTATSLGGSGSGDVDTKLVDASQEIFNWTTSGGRYVYINITTQYLTSWTTWWNDTLTTAGYVKGSDTAGWEITADYDIENLSGNTGISIQLRNVALLTVTRSVVGVTLKN